MIFKLSINIYIYININELFKLSIIENKEKNILFKSLISLIHSLI